MKRAFASRPIGALVVERDADTQARALRARLLASHIVWPDAEDALPQQFAQRRERDHRRLLIWAPAALVAAVYIAALLRAAAGALLR